MNHEFANNLNKLNIDINFGGKVKDSHGKSKISQLRVSKDCPKTGGDLFRALVKAGDSRIARDIRRQLEVSENPEKMDDEILIF